MTALAGPQAAQEADGALRPGCTVTLTLRDVGGEQEPAVPIRLRAALKRLLRSFSLRCERVEPELPDEEGD